MSDDSTAVALNNEPPGDRQFSARNQMLNPSRLSAARSDLTAHWAVKC